MNRSIGLERTYWLGDYRNLKVTDYISGIPEDVALNPEIIGLLRSIQLQSCDLTYFKYVEESVTRVEDVLNSSSQDLKSVIKTVEINRDKTFESLHEAFSSVEDLEENITVETEDKE